MNVISIFQRMFFSDSRTRIVSKNVLGLGILQIINTLISFLLVPIVMDFVSPSQYGIWLTISSMVTWLALLDVGLGNGMKNKLTESLAHGDLKLAKEYVSTTYFIIGGIALFCLILIFLVFPLINWSAVYNQDPAMNDTLMYASLIVAAFFFIKLVVGLIGTILTSYLKPAINQLLNTLSNIFVLLIIVLLKNLVNGNLLILATVLSATSVLIYFVASLYLFSGKYKEISPSLYYFNSERIKSILGLGVKFFIINISTIVLFQTNNFVIIHHFTNEDVVVYNLAYKLFSICSLLFNLISQPFWTAYTEAWAKNDITWIQSTVKKVFVLWLAIVMIGLLMLAASPLVYKLWVGDAVTIPFKMSAAILIYFISHTYGGIFNIVINGIGKVRLQMICLALVATIYIPLMLFFINVLNLGIISIPLALLISNFYSLFVARIQYTRLINGTASGVWNK